MGHLNEQTTAELHTLGEVFRAYGGREIASSTIREGGDVIDFHRAVGAHAQADTLRVLTAKLFELSAGLEVLAAAVKLQPKVDLKRLDGDVASLARQFAASKSKQADMRRRVAGLLRTPRKDN